MSSSLIPLKTFKAERVETRVKYIEAQTFSHGVVWKLRKGCCLRWHPGQFTEVQNLSERHHLKMPWWALSRTLKQGWALRRDRLNAHPCFDVFETNNPHCRKLWTFKE
ncbi:hypothetical protein TNCV_1739521 [Trichonephila clavipes]|nr:hypothetical protein TNCV_1739521 [Trichonephila clavipes]